MQVNETKETALLLSSAQVDDVQVFDPEAKPETPRFVYTLTIISAIGGLLFGYDTGVISGALLKIKDQFHLSASEQEVVVSSTVGVAIVGAALAGYCADRFGRKPTILLSSAVFTAGAVLMGASTSYELLVVGRCVVGLAIGVASMVVPIYLAETAPTHHRGTIVTVNNLFITGGQFISGLIDGAFSDVHEGWRLMLGLAAVPAVVQIVGFLFLPESPRWYVMRNKLPEAVRVLNSIRGEKGSSGGGDEDRERVHAIVSPGTIASNTSGDDDLLAAVKDVPMSHAVRHELEEVCSAVKEGGEQWTVKQVLQTRSLWKQLTLGTMLQFIQQFAGINTVMYYSGTILLSAGFASSTAIWLVALVAFFNFAFTIVGLVLVERWGRRKLTLVSLGGVILSLVFLGVVFLIQRKVRDVMRGFRSCFSPPFPGQLFAVYAVLSSC
jgi:MFS transporter, SP family, solute carrier family 2 (myo-inositol transporter), member 13